VCVSVKDVKDSLAHKKFTKQLTMNEKAGQQNRTMKLLFRKGCYSIHEQHTIFFNPKHLGYLPVNEMLDQWRLQIFRANVFVAPSEAVSITLLRLIL